MEYIRNLFRQPRRPRQNRGGYNTRNVEGIGRLFEEQQEQRRQQRRPRQNRGGYNTRNVEGVGRIFQEPQQPRRRQGEWQVETKNLRDEAVRLGFSVSQTGKRLTKDNRIIWEEFVNRSRRRQPIINQIRQQQYQLRAVPLGRFEEEKMEENIRFGAGQRFYKFVANRGRTVKLTDFVEAQLQIIESFDKLIKSFIEINRLKPDDILVISLFGSSLKSNIYIRSRVSSATATLLLDRMRQILQYDEIQLDELRIVIGYVKQQSGGGSNKYSSNASMEDIYKKSKVIKKVYNIDPNIEDCFFQCLVLGLAEMKYNFDKYNNTLIDFHVLTNTKNETSKRNSQRFREGLAQKISNDIGIELQPVPFGDIHKFEEFFNCDINIINISNLECIYPDFKKEGFKTNQNQVYMLYRENDDGTGHFDYIVNKSINALYNRDYYCHICKTAYCDKDKHKCIERCFKCMRSNCDALNKDDIKQSISLTFPEDITNNIMTFIFTNIVCNECNFSFNSHLCFDNHKGSKCKKTRLCLECNKTFRFEPRFPHQCGKKLCDTCKQVVDNESHKCFHKPLTNYDLWNKKTQKNFLRLKQENNEQNMTEFIDNLDTSNYKSVGNKYIFYDFETWINPTTNNHEVYLAVAMYSHSKEVFKFNSIVEFVDWLLKKEHTGYTCIAHNSKGFDGILIKKELVKRCVKSKEIMNGNKIMYMNLKQYKIRFVDSLNFLMMPLKDFPKNFDLDTKTFSKGFFPHDFIDSVDKLNFVGDIPDTKYFGEQVKDKFFNEWYGSFEGKVYNLREESELYCKQDVVVLKQGCMKFREIVMGLTEKKFDPWQSITIAGLSQQIYKRFDMSKQSIGVLSDNYVKTSNEEFEWIDYLRSTGISIPKQQYKICGFIVDGFNPDTNTIYEYNGCYFHGCKSCYNEYTKNCINNTFMKDLYKDWIKKKTKLTNEGYNIVEMWSHTWNEMKRTESVKKFLESYDRSNLFLDPRDAFYGGMTQPTKLYKKMKEGEYGRYVDYTSLYPTINYCRARGFTKDTMQKIEEWYYPIGHPVRIRENFHELNSYFGFIKCKITPPKNLYCPILPERDNQTKKLVFHLNTMIGTWTTEEVKYAVSLGYNVEEIYEVMHFENRSKDLFKGYVNRFFALKQQNAGWKKLKEEAGDLWRHDLEEQQARKEYVKMYEKMTGIKLDISKIPETKNSGMYFTAKLFCNSLWGKYGQRDNFSNSETVFDRNRFCQIMFDDQYESNFTFLTNNAVQVCYKKIEETLTDPTQTNIAIAGFTTAYARIRLHKALNILNNKVMYMDTDSILFVDEKDEKGNWKSGIETGLALGDFTDELGDETYITEFCSTGPKSYSFKTNNGKHQCCKVKGFNLKSGDAGMKINFDTLKKLITEQEEKIEVGVMQFKPTKYFDIKTDTSIKKFGFTFDKREINMDEVNEWEIDTTPFGYKGNQRFPLEPLPFH